MSASHNRTQLDINLKRVPPRKLLRIQYPYCTKIGRNRFSDIRKFFKPCWLTFSYTAHISPQSCKRSMTVFRPLYPLF